MMLRFNRQIKATLQATLLSVKIYWKAYLLQSFLAALAIFLVLLFFNFDHTVVIASLGSTVFLIFILPTKRSATPAPVIGGHFIGLLCGSLMALIPHEVFPLSMVLYSLAVGLSIFVMMITHTEHPPAAGTALGMAINGFSFEVAASLILSTVILSLLHYYISPYLRELSPD